MSNKAYLQPVAGRKSCMCRKKHLLGRCWHCFPSVVEYINPLRCLCSKFFLFKPEQREKRKESLPENICVELFSCGWTIFWVPELPSAMPYPHRMFPVDVTESHSCISSSNRNKGNQKRQEDLFGMKQVGKPLLKAQPGLLGW